MRHSPRSAFSDDLAIQAAFSDYALLDESGKLRPGNFNDALVESLRFLQATKEYEDWGAQIRESEAHRVAIVVEDLNKATHYLTKEEMASHPARELHLIPRNGSGNALRFGSPTVPDLVNQRESIWKHRWLSDLVSIGEKGIEARSGGESWSLDIDAVAELGRLYVRDDRLGSARVGLTIIDSLMAADILQFARDRFPRERASVRVRAIKTVRWLQLVVWPVAFEAAWAVMWRAAAAWVLASGDLLIFWVILLGLLGIRAIGRNRPDEVLSVGSSGVPVFAKRRVTTTKNTLSAAVLVFDRMVGTYSVLDPMRQSFSGFPVEALRGALLKDYEEGIPWNAVIVPVADKVRRLTNGLGAPDPRFDW